MHQYLAPSADLLLYSSDLTLNYSKYSINPKIDRIYPTL